MIYGTGVDIVNIKRVQNLIERWGKKFLNKVFSEREIDYCQNKNNVAVHLAARFAAKEAVAKMFGTGIGKINWRDIIVINDKNGKPEIELRGKARELRKELEIEKIFLSISHEKEYAIAQVIAEGGKK
ncbi:MAG: holo-ACP synthase [Bacillota bacterium]